MTMTLDVPEGAQWYTPLEVAVLFRVVPKTVVRWETDGKLEMYKVRIMRTLGGHRRYNKEDIDRMWKKINGSFIAELD
jgi:DNA-binding transcriptional MerR regulator